MECASDFDSDDPCGICVGGYCLYTLCSGHVPCDPGQPCPSGLVCDELAGLCESPPDAGPDGGGTNHGCDGVGCTARCDCDFGQVCEGGCCVALALDAGCAFDSHCARGQLCGFYHHCEPGCADGCDCQAPLLCSATRFQCESCSDENPCPSGQFCSGTPAQCLSCSPGDGGGCATDGG